MGAHGKGIAWTALLLGVFGCIFAASPASAALGEAGDLADLGAELHYFKYEEPDIMEDTGAMFGVFGRYAYRTKQNEKFSTFSELFSANPLNTFIADARVTFGSVDYTSNGTGSIDDIDEMIAEVSGKAGIDFPLSEFLLTPYIGLGFRYWSDELGGKTSTTGHAGYDRESHYLYLPIGFDLATELNNGWGASFNFEFDVFLDGTQKSHLEDVSSALNTLENDQNDGFGLRGSITLTKQIDNLVFLVEPFVRYWNIDDSTIGVVTCGGTPCALGYEPKNESLEAGARVGVRF